MSVGFTLCSTGFTSVSVGFIMISVGFEIHLGLGEDSCWPTSLCTPQTVREWMEEAKHQGKQGMWLGGCGGMRKRTFDMRVDATGRREDQTCEVKAAPCGSKLFAMTIRQLRLIEQVWGGCHEIGMLMP